jgi:hypothetical protein
MILPFPKAASENSLHQGLEDRTEPGASRPTLKRIVPNPISLDTPIASPTSCSK